MEAFPRTLDFLGGTALGVFGAGHLGRTVAGCLLRSGFPASRLMVCHGGSAETRNLLAEEGLAANVADAGTLTRSAKLILYLVRPQSVDALASHELRPDALIVSFLAGVPLARLPARIPLRVRVMPSAPATILARNAIAGVFPDGNPVVEELLRGLGFRLFSLEKEDDVHAFTAFGPCLPIVLSMLHGIGGDESDGPILDAARAHGLKGYEPILQWARGAQPVFGSEAQRSDYLKKAATPGGVTEAMLEVIESGGSLAEALDRGVSRSRELSGSV
jgi:pyrroline-5-carboxylate reductase